MFVLMMLLVGVDLFGWLGIAVVVFCFVVVFDVICDALVWVGCLYLVLG